MKYTTRGKLTHGDRLAWTKNKSVLRDAVEDGQVTDTQAQDTVAMPGNSPSPLVKNQLHADHYFLVFRLKLNFRVISDNRKQHLLSADTPNSTTHTVEVVRELDTRRKLTA